jgi:hypothetical protein
MPLFFSLSLSSPPLLPPSHSLHFHPFLLLPSPLPPILSSPPRPHHHHQHHHSNHHHHHTITIILTAGQGNASEPCPISDISPFQESSIFSESSPSAILRIVNETYTTGENLKREAIGFFKEKATDLANQVRTKKIRCRFPQCTHKPTLERIRNTLTI